MNTDIEARVNRVFQAVFDVPDLTVVGETTANDVEGWDSLTHIDLIVAVEKEFKIRFRTAEVNGMKNVGDLIRLILQKMT
jgi:acyl carrier protein